jgi:ribitol-5-phosphate 2-dehydrogenase (NADP+) / D-ribitol-5-phosphate cytidylyltransferase
MARARPVVAAVLAGGAGHRFGADRPKQLLTLAGRTVLEWSVAAFQDSPHVDEVLVVAAGSFAAEVRRLLEAAGRPEVAVIEGGRLRTDSTRNAIHALGQRDCDLLLHDAARPLVEPRIIADCVEALETAEAVTAAVPATDTIGEIGPDGRLSSVPEREHLRNIQTPQGFRLATIRSAFDLMDAMDADPSAVGGATDDCSVLLRYRPDVAITVVAGSARNIKVTHPDDLVLAERLLRD